MILLVLLMAVAPQPTGSGEAGSAVEEPMSLELSSSAFQDGQPIPSRFTCDGDDLSPALSWRGAPDGTRSLVLIMDDPDAPVGTWDHWLVWDLPADAGGLPEGITGDDSLPGGGTHGRNGWGRSDYGGPCPPSGRHRYFFKLYALDAALGLPAGTAKKDLLQAMEGHVLAEAQLMGTYARG